MKSVVIWDLDDTLVDTSALRELRAKREWREAVRRRSETCLFDGVAALLRTLQKNEIRTAVVTTSVSYYAEAILEHHKITYDALVAYHDAPRKPSPEPVLLALKKLGAEPKHAAGIGESDSDRVAYRAAGTYSIGASWSPVFVVGAWDAEAVHPSVVIQLLELGAERRPKPRGKV